MSPQDVSLVPWNSIRRPPDGEFTCLRDLFQLRFGDGVKMTPAVETPKANLPKRHQPVRQCDGRILRGKGCLRLGPALELAVEVLDRVGAA